MPAHCHGEEIGDQTLLHECPSTLPEWIQPLQNIQCANLAAPVKTNVLPDYLSSSPTHLTALPLSSYTEKMRYSTIKEKKNRTAKTQLYKRIQLDLNIKHGTYICDALIILLIFHH